MGHDEIIEAIINGTMRFPIAMLVLMGITLWLFNIANWRTTIFNR